MRYRKKPLVVDAMCFTGGNFVAVRKWQEGFGDKPKFWSVSISSPLVSQGIYAEVWDKLHSTWVGVKPFDWIIRGIEGEYYPCDGEVFKNTYEPINEDPELVDVEDLPSEAIHKAMMEKYHDGIMTAEEVLARWNGI